MHIKYYFSQIFNYLKSILHIAEIHSLNTTEITALKQPLLIMQVQMYNPDNFQGYTISDKLLILRSYEKDEINLIITTLEWAQKNPDYDFTSIFHYKEERYSNKQLYGYLRAALPEFLDILEKWDYYAELNANR